MATTAVHISVAPPRCAARISIVKPAQMVQAPRRTCPGQGG